MESNERQANSFADRIDWSAIDQAEEQTQESSLTAEETTEEVKAEEAAPETETASAESATVETTQEAFDKEAYRKQLEEELRQTLAKEYEGKAPKFANEQIARLNELAEMGIDTNSPEFWKWQTIDIDKFSVSEKDSALELRKLELEVENPDLSPAEIQRILKKNYKALFDEDLDPTDTDFQEALLDLSIDAKRSVTKLKKHKQSLELPKVDLKEQELQREAAQKAKEQFVTEVRKSVQSYKEEPVKLGDLEIKLQVDDEARKFAESAIVNNETFFLDNYVKDNVVDYARLRRDMVRIAKFDDFLKTAYEQGVSVGKESVVDELENASEDVSARKQQTQKSMMEQIHEQIRLNRQRR